VSPATLVQVSEVFDSVGVQVPVGAPGFRAWIAAEKARKRQELIDFYMENERSIAEANRRS
jgi:hypothetical protein